MTQNEDSGAPGAVKLHGSPPLGPRFGRKAAFTIGAVILAALGVIVFGIVTRDPAGGKDGENSSKALESAREVGKGITAGVPDGVPAIARMEAEYREAEERRRAIDAARRGVPDLTPSDKGGVPSLSAEQLAALQEQQQRAERLRSAMASDTGAGGMVGAGASAVAGDMRSSDKGARVPPAAGGLLREAGPDDQNKQAAKEAFLARANALPENETLAGTRRAAISSFEIKASSIIPAVLLTGLNSDLPGEMIGQVSENVYDTATGRHLLVPQGARLFGRYDSQVAYGQDRALVIWSRLIFPDGSTLSLEGMGGSDKSGYAGFHDQVNNHYGRLIGFGILTSLFGAAFQITQNNNQQQTQGGTITPSQIAGAEVGRQFAQLGMEMAKKNLNIQPTIEIRPGYRFNVLVNKDMVFGQPYAERLAVK